MFTETLFWGGLGSYVPFLLRVFSVRGERVVGRVSGWRLAGQVVVKTELGDQFIILMKRRNRLLHFQVYIGASTPAFR